MHSHIYQQQKRKGFKMNYDLYELISIVLLIGLSVFSLYYVISEIMFDRMVAKSREEMRRLKKHNALAKVDPWFQIERTRAAMWARENNKPIEVVVMINNANYLWRKFYRDPKDPQLALWK